MLQEALLLRFKSFFLSFFTIHEYLISFPYFHFNINITFARIDQKTAQKL